MKKKIIAMMTAVALLGGSLALPPFTVEGTEEERQFPLPFELTAPSNTALSIRLDNEGVNEGDLHYTWSSNDSITTFFAETTEAREARKETVKALGYDSISIETQLDWAIDDPEDWHYSEYYDFKDGINKGCDEQGHYRLGVWDAKKPYYYPENTINAAWVLNYVTVSYRYTSTESGMEEEWTGDGYYPGLRDQLKEGQYELKETRKDYIKAVINYDEHTAYIRSRLIVRITYYDEETGWHNQYIPSEWSKTAAYGKDAAKWDPYTKESLQPPVITGFHMTNEEFNGCPIVAYTLTVPEELKQAAVEVEARGGYIDIETYARVRGTEDWKKLSGTSDIRAGEMQIKTTGLVSDSIPETMQINCFTEIELKCCYYCKQLDTFNGNFVGEFRTDYSPVIVFDTTELVHEPTGISVRGVFPEGYKLMVEEKNLTVDDLQKAYELWLEEEDGTKVELPDNAALMVRIPYEDTDTRVSYFDENAAETRVETSYTEGKYVFVTNHLGVYGIITRTIGSGDVNYDGDVDVADALMISRYDAGLTYFTAEQLSLGDVSGDGAVDIADALMIARFDAGLILSFG